MTQSLKLRLSIGWLVFLLAGLSAVGLVYPDFGKVFGMVVGVCVVIVCTWLSTFTLLDHHMNKDNPYDS